MSIIEGRKKIMRVDHNCRQNKRQCEVIIAAIIPIFIRYYCFYLFDKRK